MSKYGKMVLWMGMILMALQIAAEWPFIRAQLFTGGSGSSGSSGSGGGGFHLPFPVIPPGFPIPPYLTSKTRKTAKAAK